MIAELADKLFDCDNRYNRVEFICYQILSALLFVALLSTVSLTYHWVKLLLPNNPTTVILPVLILFVGFIAYLYSSICITIKRLHDMDLSGLHVWWFVVINVCVSSISESYVVVLGTFYTLLSAGHIALALIPGTPRTNRYDDEDTTD